MQLCDPVSISGQPRKPETGIKWGCFCKTEYERIKNPKSLDNSIDINFMSSTKSFGAKGGASKISQSLSR